MQQEAHATTPEPATAQAWIRIAACMEREAVNLPPGADREVLEAWAAELRARLPLHVLH